MKEGTKDFVFIIYSNKILTFGFLGSSSGSLSLSIRPIKYTFVKCTNQLDECMLLLVIGLCQSIVTNK